MPLIAGSPRGPATERRGGRAGGWGAVRLLVVVVVTVALLVAAAPIAVTQAPRLHSPLLAVVAFGVAVIALIAGVALLVRATALGRAARGASAGPAGGRPRRRDAVAARVVPAQRGGDGQPPPDDAVTEPRPGPERILLVPTAGRITVSAEASATGPRHALVEVSARGRRQPRQDPSTVGQSPTGPSQIHAQQMSEGPDPAVEEAAERSAAFAARYTATRSRR